MLGPRERTTRSHQPATDMDEPSTPEKAGGPGVLYFDPNPTTARLATAGLRLAGYVVYAAGTQSEAIDLCRRHGPGGDGSIVALLLDTATSPEVTASLLKALVQLPGAATLPGILLVSRANPTPIPGAEGLPSIKRPFTTPALLKILREAIDSGAPLPTTRAKGMGDAVVQVLQRLLRQHLPDVQLSEEGVRSLASALVAEAELPQLASGIAFQADASMTRFDSVLAMLAEDGARGVITLQDGDRWGRLHLDRGRIRMGEAHGTEEDLRLGRFVVEAGFMSNDAVESVARTPDPEHRPIGVRLVEDGHLKPGELALVLVNQSREITWELLRWDRGKITFSPTTELHPLAEAAAHGKVELKIAEALLEGLRRIDEVAEMGPQMAAVDDVFVRLDDEVGKMGRHAFARDELAVLELLNGRNSVKDIARKTRTGTFAVSKVLYRLTRAGLARQRSTPVEG